MNRSYRPTPALLIALLALFVAIGGSAYAASIAKNSVGSAQVKNNSLKGKDIKDGRVTGSDVDESSLVGVNAAKVGGLEVGSLGTRIASDFNTNDNYLDADGQTDVNSVEFSVPVRSVVKLEISGFFVGNVSGDCPCNLRAFARVSTEPGTGAGPDLVTTANLVDYVGSFARLPYAGVRTLTLDPGTYTFLHTVVRVSGATGTNTSVGSGYSNLAVTAYPLNGSGGAPARPTQSPGRPSGSTR